MAKSKKGRQSPQASRPFRNDSGNSSSNRSSPYGSQQNLTSLADAYSGFPPEQEDIGAWNTSSEPQEYVDPNEERYQNLRNYDSPNGSGKVRFSPPADGYSSSQSTLINEYDDRQSGYHASTLLPEDSASNLNSNPYSYDGNQAGGTGFLSVPNVRSRQPSFAGSGLGPGGFSSGMDPRYSSAISVASSDKEATSDAWVRRQRIKPGRAKTKKVKLTKGRFITEYGTLGRRALVRGQN